MKTKAKKELVDKPQNPQNILEKISRKSVSKNNGNNPLYTPLKAREYKRTD